MFSGYGQVNDTSAVSMKDETKMQLYFPFLHMGYKKSYDLICSYCQSWAELKIIQNDAMT